MNEKTKITRVSIVIALNMVIVIAEIIFGIVAKSMGLVADALHNFSDVGALIITIIALVFATKKPTERMTFGYVRSEMMAGFVNSAILIFAMGMIIYESIHKLANPEPIQGIYMIVVAGVAALANLLSVFLLRGVHHAHSHAHKHDTHEGHDHDHEHTDEPAKGEDMNIKAALLHLISDVAISVAVVLGGIAIIVWKVYWIDPVLTILFAMYILYHAFGIIKSAFFSLMDRHDKDLATIIEGINTIEGVKSVHGVHLTQPSSKEAFFSAHLVMEKNVPLEEVEQVMESVREKLKCMGITHSVLQPETGKYECNGVLCSPH